MERIKIPFRFHPYKIEDNEYAVEKADDQGRKRRYVRGVSSGLKTDQHKERMTANCIKSFMDQANTGDILLYPDVHGIKASEDIGILEKGVILGDGDWFTEFRLYDEHDGIGPQKLERVDTLWKQACGLPPYTKPKQKGFSVEGYIPDSGILSAEKDAAGNLSHRVINDVMLDGVLFVPRPAYKDGIATAVYKALGEMLPEGVAIVQKSIQGSLRERLSESMMQDAYYKKKWDLQDALESQIEKIMRIPNDLNKGEKITILLEEYASLLKDLVMRSEVIFMQESEEDSDSPYGAVQVVKNSKMELYKSLLSELNNLKSAYAR